MCVPIRFKPMMKNVHMGQDDMVQKFMDRRNVVLWLIMKLLKPLMTTK